MSQRKAAMEAMKSHVVLGKLFVSLPQKDLDACAAFIEENDHLSKNDFALKVNRWMLDMPDRPKRHAAMWAICLQANGYVEEK